MTSNNFDQHTKQDIHFFSQKIPKILASAIAKFGNSPTIVDVGCGDGHLIWALSQNGHIPPGSVVFGADISPIRLERFNALTGYMGIQTEGHLVPALPDSSIDIVLSTMVIEHITDDLGHLYELARILKPGGLLYMSTVIRKRGAWYFRKAPDGRRVLDPTHLREYSSATDLNNMLQAAGFVIREQRLTRLIFPVAHPLVRWINGRWPIKDVQKLFLKGIPSFLEKLAIPIPRYRAIEILAERKTTRICEAHPQH